MKKLDFTLYDITIDECNKYTDVYYHNKYVATYMYNKISNIFYLIGKIVEKINGLLEKHDVRGVFIVRKNSLDYAVNPTIRDIFKLISSSKVDINDYIIEPLLINEKYFIDKCIGEGKDFDNSVTLIPESKLELI